MKRPLGFTILALIFGWLAIAGVANVFVFPFGPSFVVLALAYAATAGASAIGLWKTRKWATPAVRLWMAVCAIMMAWFLAGPFGAGEALREEQIAVVLVLAALFFALDRYVTTKLAYS